MIGKTINRQTFVENIINEIISVPNKIYNRSISAHGKIGKKKQFNGNMLKNIKLSIKAKCFGEPTTRLIAEAVLINKSNEEETKTSGPTSVPNIAIV